MSSLLLDTHVFLWWRIAAPRIEPARKAIAAADEVLVSIASGWECAIKISLGRLRLPEPFERGVADSGFTSLPVDCADIAIVATLPWHHRDPFDRMLIAQAMRGGHRLVTADAAFAAYGIPLLVL